MVVNPSLYAPFLAFALSLRLIVLVFQNDPQIRLLLHAEQDLVGAERVVEGERVRDEFGRTQCAGCDHLHDGLHVALLGPANVAVGIVNAAFLVLRIVPSGSVRAAEAEVDFLLVVLVARQVHADESRGDDLALLAADFRGDRHRFVALRRGGDEHSVHALSARERHRLLSQILRDKLHPPALFQPLYSRGARVEADDAAAAGLGHLHGELSEQTESDDADGLAELEVALPETLQGDGRDGRDAGVREADAVRNLHDEVLGDVAVFGVVGESGAAAGDAVADGDALDLRSDLDDDAGHGVAERNGLVELGLDFLERGPESLGLDLAEDLLHLVGHLEGLADDVLLGEAGEHALGAGAHEAGHRPDDDAVRTAQRGRDLGEPHLAGLERLKNLFHRPVLYQTTEHDRSTEMCSLCPVPLC